jgi:hypothetical protein
MLELKHPTTILPTLGSQWPVVGEGVFSWSVFRFYRARLMSESGQFDPDQPYRLEIDYLRRLSASQIANVTGVEIKRLGQAGVHCCNALPVEMVDSWVQQLKQFLPDVTLGDQLVGVFKPSEGVWFYDAEQYLGHIDDGAFVAAFTAIWLDPQTRATKLRAELLKLSQHNTALGNSSS